MRATWMRPDEATIGEKLKSKRPNGASTSALKSNLPKRAWTKYLHHRPDARTMILHSSVIEVTYNVQTVADDPTSWSWNTKSPTRTTEGLVPMAQKTKTYFAIRMPWLFYWRQGYHNGKQLYRL